MDELIIWVNSGSDPNKVGGSIAKQVRATGRALVQTIGAGALNQAVKAVAAARYMLEGEGIELVFYPAFIDVETDDGERTAIRLTCEPKDPHSWSPTIIASQPLADAVGDQRKQRVWGA